MDPSDRRRPPLVDRAPLSPVARTRLDERLSSDARVVLVVAPPGYGKTEVLRQWSEHAASDVGWLAVDPLHRDPARFWAGFLTVLSDLVGVDDEPARLLGRRGPSDPAFLDALVDQVQRAGRKGVVVVDDAWRLEAGPVREGLALLVERIGHLVRLILVERTDPPVPLAPWRTRGWVTELRADDLRFTPAETLDLAAEVPGAPIPDADVAAIAERLEGWPLGVHLCLLAIGGATPLEDRPGAIATCERALAGHIVSEVLGTLPADLAEVALSLSVLPWFDGDLCAELLGEHALPAVDALRHRQLFLAEVPDVGPDALRFHPLFRELLEQELHWHDPRRRARLHRRAARVARERCDPAAALHHLVAVGDDGALDVVLDAAARLATRDDVAPLRRLLADVPAHAAALDGDRALDLAGAWMLAGDQRAAVRWRDVAARLAAPDRSTASARACVVAGGVDLLTGAESAARDHVERFERLEVDGADPLRSQAAVVAARAALLAGDGTAAERWIGRIEGHDDPVLGTVVGPALEAWWELGHGDLRRARPQAEEAVLQADHLGLGPHLGRCDALLVETRCRIAIADLDDAATHVAQGRTEAERLGWDLPRVRAGVLAAEVLRLQGEPDEALAVLGDLRREVGPDAESELRSRIDAAEAAALLRLGRTSDARTAAGRLPTDHRRSRLLRAHLVVAGALPGPIGALLHDRGRWPQPWRLEADALVALADEDPAPLVATLEHGRAVGWVSPYLDVGDLITVRIGAPGIARSHAALSRALRPEAPGPEQLDRPLQPLTPREVSLLELLPTHLSYVELGEHLYLSVNTVKTNLKSIYRKLGVTSRADAVRTAQRVGLLASATPGAWPSAGRTRRP